MESSRFREMSLSEAGQWLSGGTPSTANSSYWGGDIPWISAASMREFSIDNSDRRLTSLGAASGTRVVPAGTVIFVIRGMSLNKEFRVGVTRCEVAFGQDCKAIIPHEFIDSDFLAHLLSAYSQSVLRMVETTSHGTGRLDVDRLAQLSFLLPELPQQRRIVEAITAFDREIAALRRRSEKLTTMESGLASAAFSAGSAPRLELGKLADVAAGVTLGSEAVGPASIELPYLRVANVLDGAIDATDLKTVRIMRSQLQRYALERGDVLLTEGGDIDKLGRGAVWNGQVEPCLHQNHVFRVRCTPRIVPEYLSLYTSSSEGRAYFLRVGKQSTNLASINSTQVRAMRIPIPPVEEQRRVLGPILAARRVRDSLLTQVVKLRTVRNAVAEELLTGKVGIKDL